MAELKNDSRRQHTPSFNTDRLLSIPKWNPSPHLRSARLPNTVSFLIKYSIQLAVFPPKECSGS
jgi:hypothetical protein